MRGRLVNVVEVEVVTNVIVRVAVRSASKSRRRLVAEAGQRTGGGEWLQAVIGAGIPAMAEGVIGLPRKAMCWLHLEAGRYSVVGEKPLLVSSEISLNRGSVCGCSNQAAECVPARDGGPGQEQEDQ